MADDRDELKKLADIANDWEMVPDIRHKAMEHIGHMGSSEALRVMLDLAANERLAVEEREQALKYAREIIRAGR
jgi:hypothetical protein